MDFFFLADRVVYSCNELPNQIRISSCIENFKIKWDDFRKNGKKENFKRDFWELSEELLNKIGFVYRDIGLILYMFEAKILFLIKKIKGWFEKLIKVGDDRRDIKQIIMFLKADVRR